MTSSWPLYLWFKVLLSQFKNDFKYTNVIAYRSINHEEEPKGSLIYPFYWLRNSYSSIWNLDMFANIIVEPFKTDEESYDVNITGQEHVKEKWLNIKKKLRIKY